MTKSQFRDRIRVICRLCKLEYDENVRALVEEARRQTAEQPHFKAPDHGVLIGLLQAAIEFPDVIQETPRVEVGDFSRRRDYATHQEKPTKYTLLREVRIHFVTDAMSHDIDMIDLPGLGVDKESDDALTLAFLPQLDGAFMFQESHQMKSATVSAVAPSGTSGSISGRLLSFKQDIEIDDGTFTQSFFQPDFQLNVSQELLRGVKLAYNLQNVRKAREGFGLAELEVERARQAKAEGAPLGGGPGRAQVGGVDGDGLPADVGR
jgi:hypothetical protein